MSGSGILAFWESYLRSSSLRCDFRLSGTCWRFFQARTVPDYLHSVRCPAAGPGVRRAGRPRCPRVARCGAVAGRAWVPPWGGARGAPRGTPVATAGRGGEGCVRGGPRTGGIK